MSSPQYFPRKRRWYNSARDPRMHSRGDSYATYIRGQQEGAGGPEGIVLPLTEIDGGAVGWGTRYTLPIEFGTDAGFRNLSVEVDTGSSDLWITSPSCSTDPCKSVGEGTYDASASSTSRATNMDFEIKYLRGAVDGSVWWDKIAIGGYEMGNQAFAVADNVENEPLSEWFTGILGLALPLNSVISSLIPPTTTDAPDGATVASNLFSMTGGSGAPSNWFMSLSLSRPGSSQIPALMGVGRHPTQLPYQGDVAKSVQYSNVLTQSSGTFFWKSTLRSLSVWVDDQERSISLPRTASPRIPSPYPSVVLDSGIPLIITSKPLADAIYGAIGVGPGRDGQYYLPCSTPLNISLQIDSRDTTWLHPLDVTAQTGQSSDATCIGLIQSFTALAAHDSSHPNLDELASAGPPVINGDIVGDIILGVPFLRNVYMVMGMEDEDDDGNFPFHRPTDVLGRVNPRLGLLGLTDPTIAADEWARVRLQGGGIDKDNPENANGGGNSQDSSSLSVGIKVLLGLGAFFAVCVMLFGIKWFLMYRRERQLESKNAKDGVRGESHGMDDVKGNYMLTRRSSSGDPDGMHDLAAIGRKTKEGEQISEDELRRMRFESHLTNRSEEPPDTPLLTAGLYGGEKDNESRSSLSSDYDAGIDVSNRDVASEMLDGSLANSQNAVSRSLISTAGHSYPSSLPDALPPPIPSPLSSPSGYPSLAIAPQTHLEPTLSTVVDTSIPHGAAKPHTFYVPASPATRPVSFSTFYLPNQDPGSQQQVSQQAQKLSPITPLVGPIMPHFPNLPNDDLSVELPATPSSLPPSSHARTISINYAPPSEEHVSTPAPIDVMMEFGVIPPSADTSVEDGGMAGIGTRSRTPVIPQVLTIPIPHDRPGSVDVTGMARPTSFGSEQTYNPQRSSTIRMDASPISPVSSNFTAGESTKTFGPHVVHPNGQDHSATIQHPAEAFIQFSSVVASPTNPSSATFPSGMSQARVRPRPERPGGPRVNSMGSS